ncbi:MAG: MFS transporter [Treponema sp.]|nr:MFS transporter [Treponema sp.]
MFSVLLLLLIYFSFVSLGLADSQLGAGWPSMHGLLNVPLHFAGFISMISAGGTVISAVFSGKIIKRFGTVIVVASGFLLTAFALLGFSFSNSFLALCLFAVPLGLGGGAIDVGLNNYVALHYKARHMSWLHCFWGVGASLGPLVMSFFLVQRNSWNLGYRTAGIIHFCLIILLILSVSLWKKSDSDDETTKNKSVGIRKALTVVGVKEALIVFFCYCTIESIAGLWGASYLVAVKGIAKETAAAAISLYFIGITSGRFISGFVSMKLNNRQMVRIGQIIIGCGIVTLLLPFKDLLSLAGLFMIGLGCAPIFPSLLHETPKNFGKEYSHVIIGLQMGCAYIGTSIMPPIFGWLTSITSFIIFPIFIGTILIVKIIFVTVLNKKVDKVKV